MVAYGLWAFLGDGQPYNSVASPTLQQISTWVSGWTEKCFAEGDDFLEPWCAMNGWSSRVLEKRRADNHAFLGFQAGICPLSSGHEDACH
jgi:hypothetical protein